MADGIKTLPVLLGMRRSQRLIGGFFVLSYVSVGMLFGDHSVLFFSIVAGAVQFFLINRKNYQEGPVFLVYLLSLVFVIWNLPRP